MEDKDTTTWDSLPHELQVSTYTRANTQITEVIDCNLSGAIAARYLQLPHRQQTMVCA